MTPQNKAKKLVSKFIDIKPTKLSDYSKIYFPTAKQCALVVVDELIKYCHPQHIVYWQEVKNHIQEL